MTDEQQNLDAEQTPDEELEANAAEEGEASGEEAELSTEEQLMAKIKEAIDVKREEVGQLRLKLTITVPRDLLDERLGEQFQELRREAQIPGFRKGRAPMKLVEKRFGSDVGSELSGQLVSTSYMAAVEKEELNPLGDPLVWVTAPETRTDSKGAEREVQVEKLLPLDEAVEHIDMPKEGSLTYACEVELKPEFELPELTGIEIKKPAIAITDEDVSGEIDRLMRVRGTFEPVEGGKVEPDDLLYVSMTMTVDGDVVHRDENFDLAARDMRIQGVPCKGLGDALKGKAVGDEATFEAAVPDDHQNTDLRGKTATFQFKLAEIKRLQVPPLDADLVASLGFEDEAELRQAIRGHLEAQLDRMLQQALREQVVDHLMEKTAVDVPQAASQRQADRLIARRRMEMYGRGVPQSEIDKATDELRAAAKVESERELKLYFVMEKIAEELEVDISEDEINGAIGAIAQQQNRRFDRVRDDLSKQGGLMSLYLQLRDEKILDQLVASAQVSEEAPPSE